MHKLRTQIKFLENSRDSLKRALAVLRCPKHAVKEDSLELLGLLSLSASSNNKLVLMEL